MRRSINRLMAWGLATGGLSSTVLAQSPPIKEPSLQLVQGTTPQPAPPTTGGTGTGGSLLEGDLSQQLSGASSAAGKASGTDGLGTGGAQGSAAGTTQPAAASAGSTTNAITGAGGAAGAAVNAPDAADLLTKSGASTGIDIQRRNGVVADVRLRGLRSTQYTAVAANGTFIPSRLDLDSVFSRFDAATVREVIVVKGPYSAIYGNGLAFLNVVTFDSPRFDCLEYHGRTALGYSTNGQRWDGLQSFIAGDKDFGFRATYNILQGNDYVSGNGTQIPSSYLSNTVNFALGWDMSSNSKIEVKGLAVEQSNLEFPSLYFDIRQLSTQAYSARYTLTDTYLFDQLTLDFWYNSTAATGDTQLPPKQAFVDALLARSFQNRIPGTPNNPNDPNAGLGQFQDFSSTNFAGRSIGYRLATSWGPANAPLLTVGTDLNVFGQGLDEYIKFQQLSGTNINTGRPIPPQPELFTQYQSIPQSQSVNPGLFFQGELKATENLKLRAGGRYDYVATGSNPRLITGNINLFGPALNLSPNANSFVLDPIIYSSDPQNAALSRQFNLGSGFLQADYAVTDKITGFAAFGYAMRAPTLTELYASGPFVGVLQQGTNRIIGDPNIKPEKLAQVDIGLRADYETWQGGINGFYGWISDYITFDANRLGSGISQVVYTNTNRATLAGAEAFGQVDLTAWLTPFGTLSYVQGIDQTANDSRRAANIDSSRRDAPLLGQRVTRTEALPQMPPIESRLGLRIHAPTPQPKWQVEMNARLVGGQQNVAFSLGELPTNAFAVFDIRTYYRCNDHWLVTFGVENIGNLNYREHLDFRSGNEIGVGPLFRQGTNFYFGSQLTY